MTTTTETLTHPPPADTPTHPDLIKVNRLPGFYATYATSLKSLPAGSKFCPLTTSASTSASKPTYATVQTGHNSHINLNSDVVYVNHSCVPSLEFDAARNEVRVSRNRDLKVGDTLTFFYPSTEWRMSQSFSCRCGEKECLGVISGAESMGRDNMGGNWLNVHIEEMLEEKEKTLAVTEA
ncbi:hypothetical protein EDC01DRAFT_718042 [Geopyxis carbonaria]|nr:hypothetical protein EDC01DRAFT_718042 [Geopyxis carbonaria]